MKNARYIMVTVHIADYNFADEKRIMTAKNPIEAIQEAAAYNRVDDQLYCVLIFEEYEKGSFRQVLRSEKNTGSFHYEASNCVIREVVEGKGKNKTSVLFYEFI